MQIVHRNPFIFNRRVGYNKSVPGDLSAREQEMIQRNLHALLIIVILAVSLWLRVYRISSDPPALSWDEVSIGYNAYSILKTGKDEHGRFLPLDTFVAYGDYKPPFAVYATVPFIALLGLNEMSVRLPSAVAGVLTVFFTYLLVLELFGRKSGSIQTHTLALVSALLLSVSPWHLNLSRAGFEANIALCFIVFGIWLILTARTIPSRWLYAWLPFVVAIYTFNSARYFSVIFAVGLCLFTIGSIRKNVRVFALGVLVAFVTLLPILPHLVSKEARLRFVEVNIFTDSSVVQKANSRMEREGNSLISKIVQNRRIGYLRSYLLHFADNLQPDFLFGKGDGNPKFSIQDVGQMYPVEGVFLFTGAVFLLAQYPAAGALLLFWIAAAIIPAATARETPHALRILNSLPVWQIVTAYGILQILAWCSARRMLHKATTALIVCVYIFQFAYYVHAYYGHYPAEFSGEWQYGYAKALSAVSDVTDRYSRVVISDNIGRPYMYTLFYTRTDPDTFFKTKDDYFDDAGFYHVRGFSKYRFGGALGALEPNTLYVWDSGSVPKGVRVIQTIKLLNGTPVLTVFDTGGVHI